MLDNNIKKSKIKKKLLIISAVVAMLLITIGASFAYFSASLTGAESGTTITVSGGTMNIAYVGGADITATGIYPSNEKFAIKNFTVTGNNTTDLQMGYSVRIIVDENTFSYGAIKYKLISTNTGANGQVIPSITEMRGVASTGYSSFVGIGYFTKTSGDKVHTYALELYFPDTGENQNKDQGKIFKAHIGITDVACTDCLKDNILAREGGIATINTKPTPNFEITAPTIVGYTEKESKEITNVNIKDIAMGYSYTVGATGFEIVNPVWEWRDQYYVSDVGKYIYDNNEFWDYGVFTKMYKILEVTDGVITKAIKHEAKPIPAPNTSGMFKADDDYGMSYYYRGVPENNYVVFANMCWRVVRIVGDGGVKMVLYNYNPSSIANPCDESQDGITNAFARYSGTTYITQYNIKNTEDNDAKFAGYMYGGSSEEPSTSYAQATANETSSTIKTNLDTWYTTKLSDYSSYLADTIWCNDRQLQNPPGGPPVGAGFGTNTTYYETFDRLDINKNPILKCTKKNDSFTVNESDKGNGLLTYPIGLLTADEVALAGGVFFNSNLNYYLFKNATGYSWSTISPGSSAGGETNVFVVNNDGNFFESNILSLTGLRPVVSLKKESKITGEGTSTNPYKIVS